MRYEDHSDVQATLREMWDTRPARRHDDRQVAGVAAAIARRYDIDPTLVRIGFVVATIAGGIGAALYIAGWAVLPVADNGPGTPPRPRRGIAVIGLILAVLVLFGWLGDGVSAASILVGLAALGLLFLLHRNRAGQLVDGGSPGGQADSPTVRPGAGQTGEGQTGTGVSLRKTGPSSVKGEQAEASPAWPPPAPTPPAWDPLGAAPFAWDLPEPSPAEPPAPPARRLPVTSVTLGAALLAAGATAIVLLLAGSLTLANVPILLGVLLAVVGLGLVVGSFARAGRGLIPIALLLCALTWVTLTAPLNRWADGEVGDERVAPRTVAEVLPLYERAVGDFELDLSGLNLAVPAAPASPPDPAGDAGPVRTRIEIGAGEVDVIVPRDADVTLNGTVGAGEMFFDGRWMDGLGLSMQETDLGEDGVASGRPIILDVQQGAGHLEVHRG